eukprot:g7989.t3
MDKYSTGKMVGKGGFGKAFLCSRIHDGKACIIKKVDVARLSFKNRQKVPESTLSNRFMFTLSCDVIFKQSFPCVDISSLKRKNEFGLEAIYISARRCGRIGKALNSGDVPDGMSFNAALLFFRNHPLLRKATDEANLLAKLSHPNIVRYWEGFFDGLVLCMVMDYAEGGDLISHLQSRREGSNLLYIAEQQVLGWLAQMTPALGYLQRPEHSAQRPQAAQHISHMLGSVGTPSYMSPEMFQGKPHNHKADMWSLGCVLYEMVSLRCAFQGNLVQIMLAQRGGLRELPPIPSRYSLQTNHLIKCLLQNDPEARLSTGDILSKPFAERYPGDSIIGRLEGTGTAKNLEVPWDPMKNARMEALRRTDSGDFDFGNPNAFIKEMLHTDLMNILRHVEHRVLQGGHRLPHRTHFKHPPSPRKERQECSPMMMASLCVGVFAIVTATLILVVAPSIHFLSTRNQAQMHDIFFGKEPWVVLCKKKHPNYRSVHRRFETASRALTESAKFGVVDCSVPLPTGKSITQMFALTNRLNMPILFVAGAEMKPVQASPWNMDSEAAMLEWASIAITPAAPPVTSTRSLETKCMKKEQCVLMMLAGQLESAEEYALKEVMARDRKVRFITMNSTMLEMSMEKRFDINDGAHHFVHFTRFNVAVTAKAGTPRWGVRVYSGKVDADSMSSFLGDVCSSEVDCEGTTELAVHEQEPSHSSLLGDLGCTMAHRVVDNADRTRGFIVLTKPDFTVGDMASAVKEQAHAINGSDGTSTAVICLEAGGVLYNLPPDCLVSEIPQAPGAADFIFVVIFIEAQTDAEATRTGSEEERKLRAAEEKITEAESERDRVEENRRRGREDAAAAAATAAVEQAAALVAERRARATEREELEGRLRVAEAKNAEFERERARVLEEAARAKNEAEAIKAYTLVGFPTKRMCADEARKGQLGVLQWLRQTGCPWDGETCCGAAERGHLDVLQWARENGCPWDKRTCARAALKGHLDVLKWARENGCPWDKYTCLNAAAGGHLDLLKWARDNGCRWDHETCWKAAEGGHLDVLRWARGNGCPWDKRTCGQAALKGHMDVLTWARQNGCPWDDETCSNAAAGGHLDVLKWARENGCPWDRETCSNAAEAGHLDVLKWARENGCPWDEYTCSNAAVGGHLEVLMWARENGCSWDDETCSNAASAGHLDVLVWARENGCSWDDETSWNAAAGGHVDVLKWVRENGCPG